MTDPTSSDPTSCKAKAAEVVIVHSSDLHVDNSYTARRHGGDGTAGLRAVLRTARDVGADLVLLAGDIFEHNRLPLDLLDATARLLGDAGMKVVILPGNHDPAMAESPWRRGGVSDPDNVRVLGVTDDEAVLLPEFELEIWGRAHRDYGNMSPLDAPRARSTRWQIATAHGHFEAAPDPRQKHHPSWLIDQSEIEATCADYVALGHWNIPVRVAGGAVNAYYSGSPELAKTVNVVRLTGSGPVEVTRAPISWDPEG
jgi:DNA repair exonuclease SbcCD nuclease subunit